jgi:hypothetical protein
MKYSNEITLAKFLTRYLGIVGEDVKKISHDDVRYLFPEVKRSSFSYIEKYPRSIEVGEVLLVNDGKKTIPYYAPNVDEITQITDIGCTSEKSHTKKALDYANMSTFELKQLLNIKFNGYHVSRTARRELEDRGVQLNKKYNREEFKKWRKDYERD